MQDRHRVSNRFCITRCHSINIYDTSSVMSSHPCMKKRSDFHITVDENRKKLDRKIIILIVGMQEELALMRGKKLD